jgi:hypothetical protein
MIFFFSFLSFVVYFILFIMSTTMKKVCNGGFTNLVLEVFKNILPIASTPTPPKQLLDLIPYGSSFIVLPTPIITSNFGFDLLWASDGSEIYMQCAHHVHESPT